MKIKLQNEPTYDLDKLLDVGRPTEISDTNGVGTPTTVGIPTPESSVGTPTSVGIPTSVGTPTGSRSKYIDKWKRENKDIIQLSFPKEMKENLKKEAEKRGMSLTKFVKEAIREYLSNHPL